MPDTLAGALETWHAALRNSPACQPSGRTSCWAPGMIILTRQALSLAGSRCRRCPMSEPDLTAELDAAEDLVMHDITTVTEWGYRRPDGHMHYCAGGEGVARYVDSRNSGAVLVRRTVTYGPWEEVAGPEDRGEEGGAR